MSILKACLKNAFEAWPVVKAGFQGEMKAPWDETLDLNPRSGAQAARQIFKLILSPDAFYNSEAGKALVPGLKRAQQEASFLTGKFIKENEDFLKMIDPVWDGAPQGTYKAEVNEELGRFLRGEVKVEELTPEYRNSMSKTKEWIIDLFNNTKAFQDLKGIRGKEGMHFEPWTLDDDVIEKTHRVLFDKNNPEAGRHGLVSMVPKEVPFRIIEAGSAADVSAVDWLRAAVPMIARKNQFDPMIKEMRDSMLQLNPLEKDYTEAMINRIVGKKSTFQQKVDTLINTVSQATTGKPLTISPSGKVAAGIQKAFFDGIMMYNPGMAFLNLTQTLNTMAKEGFLPTLKGLQAHLSSSGRVLSAEREFLGDLDKFFFRSMDQSALRTGMQKFEHAGYKLFNGAENFNRGVAFHVGLGRFMQENGIKSLDDFLAMRGSDTFKQGMLTGINAANETQFLYGVVNQSPYLTTPFAKLLGGQFMSFPLRQTEFFMKEFRREKFGALPRYLAYTGIASAGAYYGLGMAIGSQLGGAGSVPLALDLLEEGKTSEAIWTAGTGLFQGTLGKFAAEPQSLTRGLTPFGGFLLDAIALGGEGDPEVKWAKFGRSASMMIPAGLQVRRIIESTMTQAIQEGERHRPAGFQESFAPILTALSAASDELFDEPIPGVAPRFTGSLSENESMTESVAKAAGIRTREAELNDRIERINANEDAEAKGESSDHARIMAQALLNGTPEEFNAALQAAVDSGIYVTDKSLNQSLENAIMRQMLTDKERQEKKSPLAARIRRMQ